MSLIFDPGGHAQLGGYKLFCNRLETAYRHNSENWFNRYTVPWRAMVDVQDHKIQNSATEE
jgi:hypothetical protein